MKNIALSFILLSIVSIQESACADVGSSPAKLWVLRLGPGKDLTTEISQFVKKNRIEAGAIVTTVGSLKSSKIRYANKPDYISVEGPLEIVALVGTVSPESQHLHIAVADGKGQMLGGHISEGSIVFTTAEIVIAEGTSWKFTRETDPQTTYQELAPKRRQ